MMMMMTIVSSITNNKKEVTAMEERENSKIACNFLNIDRAVLKSHIRV
jgi:hypothetical protein